MPELSVQAIRTPRFIRRKLRVLRNRHTKLWFGQNWSMHHIVGIVTQKSSDI